jgi:hypothetical protein
MPFAAALVGGGIGLLGSTMAAKESKQAAIESARINKAPWEAQQPYLKQGFAQAQDALAAATGMGTFQGPYTADLNPFQTQGWNTAADFATNQGVQGANTVFGAGMDNIGSASQFGTNASTLFGQAGINPTEQIIGNGAQYANNPYLSGQIDAASRDVVRNLNENQLTGLDGMAAGTGNMNSSRTGVAQGIMQRGAADQIGDISAQMRGQAYNNGLGMAQQQYNQGMSNMLNANGQLMQAGQFGADQIANGLNIGYNSGNVLAQAGAGFQNQAQNVINGQRDQFKDQQNNQMDLLGKYMSLINGNYASGSANIQPANTFGNVASGALTGMSIYNQMNKSTSPNPNASTVGSYGNGYDSLGTTGDYSPSGSFDVSGWS